MQAVAQPRGRGTDDVDELVRRACDLGRPHAEEGTHRAGSQGELDPVLVAVVVDVRGRRRQTGQTEPYAVGPFPPSATVSGSSRGTTSVTVPDGIPTWTPAG